MHLATMLQVDLEDPGALFLLVLSRLATDNKVRVSLDTQMSLLNDTWWRSIEIQPIVR